MFNTRLFASVALVTACFTAIAAGANSVQCDKDFPKLVAAADKTNIEAKGTVSVDKDWTCTRVDSTVTVVRNGVPLTVGAEGTLLVVNNAWGKWTYGPYINDTYTLIITATFQKGMVVETKTISYTCTITGAGLGTVVLNPVPGGED